MGFRTIVARLLVALCCVLPLTKSFARPMQSVPPSSDCRFDVTPLPRFSGVVARILPGIDGSIAGVLFKSGTEVELPPGLASVDHGLRPGVTLSVRGLAAPSLDFVEAFALEDTTLRCAPPFDVSPIASPLVSISGRVVRLLHADDARVNGAILEDGTVIRLPRGLYARQIDPHVAFHVGSPIFVRGFGIATAYGPLVIAQSLGPDRLRAVILNGQMPINAGPPPGSSGYDYIEVAPPSAP